MKRLIISITAISLFWIFPSSPLFAAESNFTVATFNIEWLGYPRNSGEWSGSRASQILEAADEIRLLNADIVALQEIIIDPVNGDALADLLSELNRTDLTTTWSGIYNTRFSYWWDPDFSDYPAQRQAYIWKNNSVDFVSSQTLLDWIPQGDSRFASGRLPLLLNVKIKLGSFSRQISLVNLHLKCCRGSADRRLTSMSTLLEELHDNYAKDDLIILGDFNVADRGGAFGEILEWGFYDDDDDNGSPDFYHAAGATADLSWSDIDHVIISDELLEAWTAVNTSDRNGTQSSRVSDHQPIFARFYLHLTPAEMYIQWQSSFASLDTNFAANNNDADDPDQDGIPNYLEFALGTSPIHKNKASEILVLSVTDEGKTTLSFSLRQGLEETAPVLHRQQLNENFEQWLPLDEQPDVVKTILSGEDGFDQITYQLNNGALIDSSLYRLNTTPPLP